MNIKRTLKIIGPGIAVAATGVGAGDMVAAAIAGSKYGMSVAWAALVGSILKFALSEGLARWQLGNGEPILHGWIKYLGKPVKYYFLIYLLIWTVVVSGALVVGCGMAAHALFPSISVTVWGITHSLMACAFVYWGKYERFESVMKVLIGLMFLSFIGTAFTIQDPFTIFKESIFNMAIPEGSGKFLLGVIGGVGGTLTLLSYGYWIKEKKWEKTEDLEKVHLDLFVGYALTGLFGFSIIVLASKALLGGGIEIKGNQGVIQMAHMLEGDLGAMGKYIFIIGFWAATLTSSIGVWQSIPYIFCDFVSTNWPDKRESILSTKSKWYKGYLLYITFASIPLLFFQKPVLIIIIYSVIGAMFMPFLAGTLLYMNSKSEWVGKELVNKVPSTLVLIISLLLFGYLSYESLMRAISKISI
jgi:Mn2+/Fe2+ NRAMP family transporter